MATSTLAMSLKDYCSYDALGLAELVRKKEIKPSEVCNLALAATEKVNPTINAVIQSYPERAEKADETVDINTPFAGVPLFLKDLTGEKDCLVESGSRLMEGFRAKADCQQVKLFRKNGIVIMGRCTAPEFGGGGCTQSTLNGVTNNPWDLSRTAGGSSGGSAALVAAGIAPITQSGDGGGSTRYPASCCGLVGLKTSRGMVSVGPDTGDTTSPLISKFIVSRTVRDSAAMLDALHEPAPGEAVPFCRIEKPFLEEIADAGPRLKIALSLKGWITDIADADMDPRILEVDRKIRDKVDPIPFPEVEKRIRETARVLESLGHTVEEIDEPPVNSYKVHEAYMKGALPLFRGIIQGAAQMMGRPIGPDTLEPVTLRYYEEGKRYGLADFLEFMSATNIYARQLGEFFCNYDVMLSPVSGMTVAPHGDHSLLRKNVGGLEHLWESYYKAPYQAVQNLSGVPGLSVPAGLDKDGLPVGAQLTGPIGGDARLLKVAAELEQAMPWCDLHPPVFAGN